MTNAPICYKCLSDMESDGGNAWVCRECGHKVEIDDGQKRVKPVHDSTTAFDWFFQDVFGMRRVANSGSETPPKQGTEGARSGWCCQKCGAVLSPLQGFCPFCAPAPKITCDTIGL